jgi:transposase
VLFRSLTVREVAEEVGICKSSCHQILTNKLKMRRVATKFVPYLMRDALLIREFLTKYETTVVPQPPYSPDLAPADFFLFPQLKSSLKGRRFQTIEEIEENWTRDLRTIPQNKFQDAFQNWKKRWERCIKSGGEYFEGDKFD